MLKNWGTLTAACSLHLPFCMGTCKSPASLSDGHSIDFTCTAQHLLQLDQYGKPGDKVVMAFDGAAIEKPASPEASRFLCIKYPPVVNEGLRVETRFFIELQ